MSDLLRMTGLASGMDTQSIVEGLISAQRYKTTKLQGEQKKVEWKQEAWKTMNSKLYSFYTGKLSDVRMTATYSAKKSVLSDTSLATVKASSNAVLGTQELTVEALAKSGYLTGGQITKKQDGTSIDVTSSTKISDLGLMEEGGASKTISLKVGGEDKSVELKADMTMAQVAKAFADQGLNASFDANQKRFFISSKESGLAANFTIGSTTDNKTQSLLNGLGLTSADAVKRDGKDAEITLNGAKFTSKTNTFDINGLSISVNKLSDKDASGNSIVSTLTTSTDVDGIYDTIKSFFKEYNELIKEMDTKYNADDASKYKMLTDDEKEAMSEDEVEKWENKIKDALLRRDANLDKVISSFKNSMMSAIEIDGKQYSLSNFGINTLNYFEAGDNEKGMYHIDGNADDETTKSKDDVLKKMIGSDPELVQKFFSQLTSGLYNSLQQQMSRVEGTRSYGKLYDDKLLQSSYDKLTKDIKEQETYVSDLEDKYYEQFAKMETALSKMQNQTNSLASMLG